MPTTNSAAKRPPKRHTLLAACLQILLCLTLGIATTYALAWSAAWHVRNAPSEDLAVAAFVRGNTSTIRCFDATRYVNWGALHASMQVYGDYSALEEAERRRVYRLFAESSEFRPPMRAPQESGEVIATRPGPSRSPDELWRSIRAKARVEQWHAAEFSDLSKALRQAQQGSAYCNMPRPPARFTWTECGWPATCLRLVHLDVANTKVSDPHLPKDWQLKPTSFVLPIELPLKPLWPGMLINVACFTAAWFTLLFAARRLITHTIRLHRTRHNRCPACAYSLAGVTTNRCPECGDPQIRPTAQTPTTPAS
jgi:rubrerythrin